MERLRHREIGTERGKGNSDTDAQFTPMLSVENTYEFPERGYNPGFRSPRQDGFFCLAKRLDGPMSLCFFHLFSPFRLLLQNSLDWDIYKQ
jgi:hypothetical protein